MRKIDDVRTRLVVPSITISDLVLADLICDHSSGQSSLEVRTKGFIIESEDDLKKNPHMLSDKMNVRIGEVALQFGSTFNFIGGIEIRYLPKDEAAAKSLYYALLQHKKRLIWLTKFEVAFVPLLIFGFIVGYCSAYYLDPLFSIAFGSVGTILALVVPFAISASGILYFFLKYARNSIWSSRADALKQSGLLALLGVIAVDLVVVFLAHIFGWNN